MFEPYYWALDRSVRCEIAYGGERAPDELIEWAARNVLLRSFVERVTTQDAVGQIIAWLREPRARLALVLGDFGTGKTFLLHELARRIPAEIPHLVPMLIELRR